MNSEADGCSTFVVSTSEDTEHNKEEYTEITSELASSFPLSSSSTDIEEGATMGIHVADWMEVPQRQSCPRQQSLPSNHQPSRVPNLCAICLDHYSLGDTLVWSANAECSHVYHRDCLITYLAHSQGDSHPCPTCRREGFVQFPDKDSSKRESSKSNDLSAVEEDEEVVDDSVVIATAV